MRHFRRQPRVRVYARVDTPRPLRQAMDVAERESERLAAAVVAARERLRVTQEEFAALAGLSLTTIQRIEQMRITPRTKTFSGLDQGAGWVPGSARGVFRDGREPVIADDEAMAKSRSRDEAFRTLANIKKHLPDQLDMVVQLADMIRSGEITDADVAQIISDL